MKLCQFEVWWLIAVIYKTIIEKPKKIVTENEI